MEYTVIKVSVENRVATVKLNRPEVNNAFLPASYTEIADAMRVLGEDNSVGVIVMTGEGKHFSAGGDIKRFKHLIDSGEYLNADPVTDAGKMPYAVRNCKKPVIAMINGVATGAGLSCALAADFRAVQPSSKMIMGFVNMGIGGDTAAIYNLVRLIGPEKAEMMMMTGDAMRGEDCYKNGLASILAQEGELEKTTYAFASKLAAKSSLAHSIQKELVNSFYYDKLPAVMRKEGELMAFASRQPDFSEAVNAFLEKRTPQYNQSKIQ